MQPSSRANSSAGSRPQSTGPARLASGCAVTALLVLLAVIGASAEHGTAGSPLRRGPASVLLSIFVTLGGLAGIASLALLFWGLVTRNRGTLDSGTPKRHSPLLVAGVLLGLFSCMSFLLALAARSRHLHSLGGLSGPSVSRPSPAVNSLPFNQTASITTAGLVVGIVLVVVIAKVVRAIGWHRAFARLRPFMSEAATDSYPEDDPLSELETLASLISGVSVADPGDEPDPRRAVVACYLRLLEIAARCGPERHSSETPAEYLRRVLSFTEAAAAPATSLTGLFERARYSRQQVTESMRSEAIASLDSLQSELTVGAVR